jgi:hypothetical protein
MSADASEERAASSFGIGKVFALKMDAASVNIYQTT